MKEAIYRHFKNGAMCTLVTISCTLALNVYGGSVDDVVHGASDREANFGVVVQNDNYTIYRSAMLGKQGLKHLSNYLEVHNMPFPKTIIYMNKQGYSFPLYFAIEEYKASLSGKYGEFEYFHPFSEYRTYVDGQNPYEAKEDIDTDLTLGPIGKRYFHLFDDGIDGGVETVINILKLIVDTERQPVLFHCLGGLHRTGMIGMSVRYLQGGYWVDGPKTEVQGIELNPAEYEYFKYNPLIFRPNNIKFIRKFTQDPRFLELKEKYGEAMAKDDKHPYWGDEQDAQAPADLDPNAEDLN